MSNVNAMEVAVTPAHSTFGRDYAGNGGLCSSWDIAVENWLFLGLHAALICRCKT